MGKRIRMWEIIRLDHRYYWLPYDPEEDTPGWTGGSDEIIVEFPEGWDVWKTGCGDYIIEIPDVTQGTNYELIKNIGDEPYICYTGYDGKEFKTKLKYEYARNI